MSFGLESDRTVRDAVDAFLEGRLAPDLPGSTWFETKNSRYTLLDGVLVGAKQAALVGAELVGWLDERRGARSVHARWSPGSRAILVDRREGKQLVVTSAVRRLGVDERERPTSSAPPPTAGASAVQAWTDTTTASGPPSIPPETTVIGRMFGPGTTPPTRLSSRPPTNGLRLQSPVPPAGAARSPLTALAQHHRSSIGARAAAALAAKGHVAPGVPLPKRPSPMATAAVPPPPPSHADRAAGVAPVVPSE